MPWQTISNALGSTEGGSLDRLVAALRAAIGLGPQRQGVQRATFTTAVVALAAKLTKADGASIRIEEETFERLFQFDADEAANIRWLYRLAAQDTAGFEAYAREVASALADSPDLKRDVFDTLLHIATADGVLHAGEESYLLRVSDIFGFSVTRYRAMRARFVSDASDPYVALGVSPDLDNEALKQRYRELVRRHHPDALAARGLNGELQKVAERQLAGINAAWDQIARERGL